MRADKKHIFYFVIPLIVGLVVYIPVLNNGFVNWDDPANFIENPWISSEGLSLWERLEGIFTSDVLGNYNPLSISSFLIDNALFGIDNPGGWHMINLLLHLAVTAWVYVFIIRLTDSGLTAFFASLIFAIHPLHVESVAWVTERKDVLFALFYMSGLAVYIKSAWNTPQDRRILIHLLFVLSLLSKIQAVSFPLSLVLVDYFKTGKLTTKQFTSKWSYFLLSLITGVAGLLFLSRKGSLTLGEETFSFVQNMALGSVSLPVYVFKTLIPIQLSAYYPYPNEIAWYHYASFLIWPLLLIILIHAYRKAYKHLFFGLGFFIVNIFFVLQFLKAGQGYLADRFMYIPLLGLIFIFVRHLVLWGEKNRTKRWILFGMTTVYLLLLSKQTFEQSKVWKNGESLWSNVIDHYPESMRAYAARGNYYYRHGNLSAALNDYSKGLDIKINAELLSNRAKVYMQLPDGPDLSRALEDLDKAILMEPGQAEYWLNRGVVYTRLSNFNSAVANYRQAANLDSGMYQAYLNLGKVYAALGMTGPAIENYRIYLELQPGDASARAELNRLATSLGN